MVAIGRAWMPGPMRSSIPASQEMVESSRVRLPGQRVRMRPSTSRSVSAMIESVDQPLDPMTTSRWGVPAC